MKIIFENKKKLEKGHIRVSLDGGVTYNSYNIEDVLEDGIPLDDSQDFNKVKIKGSTSLLQNTDIISSVKLGGELTKDLQFIIDTEKYGSNFPDYVTGVIIPDGTTSISGFGLSYYPNLTSIAIPDGVTEIGNNAFTSSKLTSVAIPNSVTSIGKNAFKYCSGLTNLNIPGSVTSMGEYAFEGCHSLTNVTISDGVTEIGDWAFYDCSLTNINIPASITRISASAFNSCETLTNIKVDENNQNYSTSEDGKVLFNKDKTTLRCYPSANGDYIIPDGVTSIDKYAFYASKLTSVVIPDGVTDIWMNSFESCRKLISVVIPASVTSIYRSAFSDCTNLKNINYKGTKEQWNKIYKGSYWDSNSYKYTINYNFQG